MGLYAQQPGYLLVCQAFKHRQAEHLPVAEGQPVDGLQNIVVGDGNVRLPPVNGVSRFIDGDKRAVLLLHIEQANVPDNLVHPLPPFFRRAHLVDVAEYKQESIVEKVFGSTVVSSVFTAMGQQLVVHGRVELSHGRPVALLASPYQLLHDRSYLMTFMPSVTHIPFLPFGNGIPFKS